MYPRVAIGLYGFVRNAAEEHYNFSRMLRDHLPPYVRDMFIFTMSDQHEQGFTETNKKITIDVLKEIYQGFDVIAHIWDYNPEMFKRLVPEEYKERCDLPGSGRLYRLYSQVYHTCQGIQFVLDNEDPRYPYDFILLTRPDTFLYRFSEQVFTITEYVPHKPLVTPLKDFPHITEACDHFIVLPRAFAEARAACFRNLTRYLHEFFLPNNILPWCEACFGYHDYVFNIPKQVCHFYDGCIEHNQRKFEICKRIFEEEKRQKEELPPTDNT